jgi:hypothetical protein
VDGKGAARRLRDSRQRVLKDGSNKMKGANGAGEQGREHGMWRGE